MEFPGKFRANPQGLGKGHESLCHYAMQDIAKTPDVEVRELLAEVEIDPLVVARITLDKKMVIPDVAVAQPCLMQALESPAAFPDS